MATNPLPPDLQSLYDTVVQAASDASAADATKTQTAAALTQAQTADTAAAADQLAKHQASTAAVQAFIAQFQIDYPPT